MNTKQKSIDAVLSELNEKQLQATRHREGPLLIVAGAGTGKTMTLAHRVAFLIASGIDPGRVLLLTYTRRAAAEMLRRVEGILRRMAVAGESSGRVQRQVARKVCGGTFHAVASALLRRHGKLIGLEPQFTILDRSDSEDLMNVLRADLELPEAATRFPLKGTCLTIYSRCVSTQKPLSKVLEDHFPWCQEHEQSLQQLFNSYVDRKEIHAVLDYDDLLLFWHALVSEPKAAEAIRRKFDCVLVDEYQDTNVLQAEILKNLCPDGSGLTVVGDDAQSIYSFRAATVRNILEFPDHYPGTTVVTLEQNYRSTQPILDAANAVIREAKHRHEKELWSEKTNGRQPLLVNCQDEDEQTDYVVDQILENRETGTALKQQAVLFRASHHSLSLEVELSRRNIPFHKYGGLKFIETAHVKDLLAILRFAENPKDAISGTRVLLLLPGIGRKKAQDLLSTLSQAFHNFEAWDDFKPPSVARDLWPKFVGLLKKLASGQGTQNDVAADVHSVRTFYAPLLEQTLDHPEARLRDLEQLEQVATRFPDRAAFLSEITLDPPSSTQELAGDPLLDEDYLILSTIHSAKGLEWDSVFVIHAADGNIPSDMATGSAEEIEEERRLFYVAMTRARQQLTVCHPERYYFHSRHRSDNHSFSQLTRFLPEGIRGLFERCVAGNRGDDVSEPEAASSDLNTTEIRRRIKRMWA